MDLIVVLFALVIVGISYIKIANYFQIVDRPNHRSSHTKSTIRGGGILFVFAILIYFLTSKFQYPYFILGVSLIAVISFIDDIISLSSTLRLPFQFLAIGLCLFQIGLISNNFLIVIPLLIIGVGFINIYNFMDGINGITGLYSIVVLLGVSLINLRENIIDNNLIIYVFFSLCIFGFYNFRKKARIFAGDIGSISIAIFIFFIGVLMIKELKSPLILLFIVVYGTDAILTLLYRKFYLKENITEPHRHHIYQKMVHILKFSHLKVSLWYALIQLIICVLVYKTYQLKLSTQLVVFISIVMSFILFYIFMFRKIENIKNTDG